MSAERSTPSALLGFVRESNRIEGIHREPTPIELLNHEGLLGKPELDVAMIEGFVMNIAAARLRDRQGMDVRVGSHLPPRGGPKIRRALDGLLISINISEFTPYEAHLRYESLHPFLDGNGRSGRAIWAWQMLRQGDDPFALPFLHRFYYQALDASGR